jgi:propanol-preferring alcohol dehydrogenase
LVCAKAPFTNLGVNVVSGAGATAYGGLLSVGLVKGQWLAVVGCGGLGHLLIQFAKAKELNVLAGEVAHGN